MELAKATGHLYRYLGTPIPFGVRESQRLGFLPDPGAGSPRFWGEGGKGEVDLTGASPGVSFAGVALEPT